MSEIERLELADIEAGTKIHVKAGEDPEAFIYSFNIIEPAETPYCEMTQTNPDGSIVGPAPAILEGCGRWTTPEQNPVQRGDILAGKRHQSLAMSIGRGTLFLGGRIIVQDATDRNKQPKDRYELMPDCTAITLEPPKTKNT